MRGPVGSKLRLVIQRADEAETQVKLITRASVKLEAVTSSMQSVNGQKVGFVRIKQFSTSTATDVKAALESLSGAKAYVLDLHAPTTASNPLLPLQEARAQAAHPLPPLRETRPHAAHRQLRAKRRALASGRRGNTGGYFPGGVDVAKLFLKADTPITFVVDKRREVTTYQTFEDGTTHRRERPTRRPSAAAATGCRMAERAIAADRLAA